VHNPPVLDGTSPSWERRNEKVASQLAREIARGIASGPLPPGSALESEAAMIERYQVSRASLREALRILETQGIITIKPGPGGGPLVSEVDSTDFGRMATLYFQVLGVRLGDVVDSRLAIEPVMAALAAQRDDPEAKQELVEIARAGWDADSQADWLRLSDAFHTHVVGMSGNKLLGLVARALKDIYTTRVAGLVFPPAEKDHVRTVHDKIAQAIVGGNAKRAEQLMREHMEEYAKNLVARHPSLMEEVVDWR